MGHIRSPSTEGNRVAGRRAQGALPPQERAMPATGACLLSSFERVRSNAIALPG